MSDEITIYFRWLFIAPDKRQYQQGSSKLVPSPLLEYEYTMETMTPQYVAVSIPLDPEYIENYREFRPDEKILEELGYDNPKKEVEHTPLPVLTISGMRLVRDTLQIEENTSEFEQEDDKDWNF